MGKYFSAQGQVTRNNSSELNQNQTEPRFYVCPCYLQFGERGGSMVERRTPEREVGGSKPTSAVLCL